MSSSHTSAGVGLGVGIFFGTGHQAGVLEKVARLLGLEFVEVG